MESLKITVECLRDLVAFHHERVTGYRNMMESLADDEQHLITLFNAFIAQSSVMGEELSNLSADWRWDGEKLEDGGKYGVAWSVVKAVFSSNMPCYLIDRCRSGENALLIAYHSVESTDGLAESVRLLVNRQKREVVAAREWIAHFDSIPAARPLQEQTIVAVI